MPEEIQLTSTTSTFRKLNISFGNDKKPWKKPKVDSIKERNKLVEKYTATEYNHLYHLKNLENIQNKEESPK